MAISRYYSSTAGRMTLVGAITNSQTSLIVDTTTGLPGTTPFTIIIDPGVSAKEEIVTVTAVGGTTLTITRGEDGTTGIAHDNGAEVRHGISARDLADSRTHEAASSSVHGVSGSVVGTTSAQTLTNKSIDGGTNTLTNIGKSSLPVDAAYINDVQTLTNKTIDGGSNTLTNIGKSSIPGVTAYTDASNSFSGNQTFLSSAAAGVPIVAKGAASQTGDLQQWKNNAGTTLAKIDASGNATVANITGAAATFSGNVSASNLDLPANAPRCIMWRNAGLSVPTSTETNIPLDTVMEDSDSMADTTNHRIKITTPGMYVITAGMAYPSGAPAGFRRLILFLNATIAAGHSADNPGVGWAHYVSCSALVRCSAGDTVSMSTVQVTGGTISIAAGVHTRISAVWVAP